MPIELTLLAGAGLATWIVTASRKARRKIPPPLHRLGIAAPKSAVVVKRLGQSADHPTIWRP